MPSTPPSPKAFPAALGPPARTASGARWMPWPAAGGTRWSTRAGGNWTPGRRPPSGWSPSRRGRSRSTTAARSASAARACADTGCGHRACWIEEAHVTELTGLLRQGPDGDQLKDWPTSMRIFARRERPHPAPSCRCSSTRTATATSCGSPTCPRTPRAGAGRTPYRRRPPRARPGRGLDPHREGDRDRPVPLPRLQVQPGLAHRGHDGADPARLAQALRPRRRPGQGRAEDAAHRVLHAAARLVRGGRRRRWKFPASWSWAEAITRAWKRICALPDTC